MQSHEYTHEGFERMVRILQLVADGWKWLRSAFAIVQVSPAKP